MPSIIICLTLVGFIAWGLVFINSQTYRGDNKGDSLMIIVGFLSIICGIIAIIMSFVFFGFGSFRGVKAGTVVCALLNGWLIGRFSKLNEHFFEFKDKIRNKKIFK